MTSGEAMLAKKEARQGFERRPDSVVGGFTNDAEGVSYSTMRSFGLGGLGLPRGFGRALTT